MLLRYATLDDLPQVADIAMLAPVELEHLADDTKEEIVEYLTPYVTEGIFIVAQDKDMIVGFCNAEPMLAGNSYIDLLAVHPDYRKQNVGTQLLSVIKQKLQEKGFSNVNLLCVYNNTKAINFYNRTGFMQHKNKTLYVYEF